LLLLYVEIIFFKKIDKNNVLSIFNKNIIMLRYNNRCFKSNMYYTPVLNTGNYTYYSGGGGNNGNGKNIFYLIFISNMYILYKSIK